MMMMKIVMMGIVDGDDGNHVDGGDGNGDSYDNDSTLDDGKYRIELMFNNICTNTQFY